MTATSSEHGDQKVIYAQALSQVPMTQQSVADEVLPQEGSQS